MTTASLTTANTQMYKDSTEQKWPICPVLLATSVAQCSHGEQVKDIPICIYQVQNQAGKSHSSVHKLIGYDCSW